MSFWYLLREPEFRQGAFNMAADQHLLALMENGALDAPILRIYGWAQPTFSLGYHQEWQQTLRLPALQSHGLDLVRRWTGGRAVLHDLNEITYSVIAPLHAPFAAKVSHNYALIGTALERFTDLGTVRADMALTGETAKDVRQMRHAPCFASLSESEIEKGGRKMIGSAQKLGKRAFLQHGSIPLIHRPDVLEEVTGTRLDMSRLMTSIEEHYNGAGLTMPARETLVDRLVESFAAAFSVAFRDLNHLEFPNEHEIKRIAEDRFSRDSWTFRK